MVRPPTGDFTASGVARALNVEKAQQHRHEGTPDKSASARPNIDWGITARASSRNNPYLNTPQLNHPSDLGGDAPALFRFRNVSQLHPAISGDGSEAKDDGNECRDPRMGGHRQSANALQSAHIEHLHRRQGCLQVARRAPWLELCWLSSWAAVFFGSLRIRRWEQIFST